MTKPRTHARLRAAETQAPKTARKQPVSLSARPEARPAGRARSRGVPPYIPAAPGNAMRGPSPKVRAVQWAALNY